MLACKDYQKEEIYKLVNISGCISEKLNNTVFVNEYLNLISSQNDYEYDIETKSHVIKNCHINCDGCTAKSNGDNKQNWTKCRNNYHCLQKGNCIDKCSENYFSKDKIYYECNESCKTCENNAKSCTCCIEGKYVNKSALKCEKCSPYCQTWSDGEANETQNCLNCNETSNYSILFNNNCLDNCPENLILYDNKCLDKCPNKMVVI